MNSPLVSYLKTLAVCVLVGVLLVLVLKILVVILPILMGIGIVVALGYLIYLAVRGSYAEHKHYLAHEKPFDDAMAKLYKEARKTAWADLKRQWAEFRDKKATP